MIVANKFYEKDPELLKEQIEKSFLSDLGPGEFCNTENNVKAIIAPHAGYFFSGPCSAWAYKDLGESRTDDVYIILAPSHTGMGFTSLTTQDYETPFGVASVNQELAKILIEEGMRDDITSHELEHAVEVQLPFLHYVTNGNFSFVPIVISGDMNLRRISDIILKAVSKFNKDVKFIVSSDFTHLGGAYNYFPDKKVEELDSTAAKIICDLGYTEFNEFLEETGDTICGAMPILVLMRILYGYRGEVLKYYKSSDILDQGEGSVSYFAISFLKDEE